MERETPRNVDEVRSFDKSALPGERLNLLPNPSFRRLQRWLDSSAALTSASMAFLAKTANPSGVKVVIAIHVFNFLGVKFARCELHIGEG